MSYVKSAPSIRSNWKIFPKKNSLNLRPKMPCFGIFGVKFWKTISYLKQHPQICQTEKYCGKPKLSKFWTKNALFGFFGAIILRNYCHIWNQHPQISLIAKFSEKTKISKFGTKYAWLLYFSGSILKNYSHI